jgi:seryl-tRNA synthetase
MLEINYIEENKTNVISKLERKHIYDAADRIEKVLVINKQRKDNQLALDTAYAQVNQLSKQIEQFLVTGSKEKIEPLKIQSKQLKTGIKELELALDKYKEVLQLMLYELPNLPNENVPIGKDAADNRIVYQVANLPANQKSHLPHWELATKYDIIDFELGNKLTGAGFPVYKGKGAKLQRALINFFLDEAIHAGYVEIQPPILVNRDSVYGTGQLPDKEGQMYELLNDPFYLISTAEIPVTNLYRGQILSKDVLPIRHVAYTPCFRREAGSWGSHVRGLNRLHQFDKVEIVQVTLPEHSYETLEQMRSYVEGLVQKLELPYRVLALCSGDLSFASAFTYDIEVFSVGQNRWLEVSSISNFETYQANRMQLRYKKDNTHKQLLHTLNGSAIALPRIMAALLELNSTEKGIKIPDILKNYTNFDYIS